MLILKKIFFKYIKNIYFKSLEKKEKKSQKHKNELKKEAKCLGLND
jgi:hypothetical protein